MFERGLNCLLSASCRLDRVARSLNASPICAKQGFHIKNYRGVYLFLFARKICNRPLPSLNKSGTGNLRDLVIEKFSFGHRFVRERFFHDRRFC